MKTTWWWWLSSPSPSFHLDVNIIIIMWWWHGNDYDDDDDDDNNNDDDGTMLFSFYHCKMLHILQWTHCKFTVLPGILIVNLQCTMLLHCKFTVGTSWEIDSKEMAFTVGIQWLYSGHTVYLQCAHCKIIQCRGLLIPFPLEKIAFLRPLHCKTTVNLQCKCLYPLYTQCIPTVNFKVVFTVATVKPL